MSERLTNRGILTRAALSAAVLFGGNTITAGPVEGRDSLGASGCEITADYQKKDQKLISEKGIRLLEEIARRGNFTKLQPIVCNDDASNYMPTIVTWGSTSTESVVYDVLREDEDFVEVPFTNVDQGDIVSQDLTLSEGYNSLNLRKEDLHDTYLFGSFFIPRRDVRVFARSESTGPGKFFLVEATGIDGVEGFRLLVDNSLRTLIEANNPESRQLYESFDGTEIPGFTEEDLANDDVEYPIIEAYPQIIVIPDSPSAYPR